MTGGIPTNFKHEIGTANIFGANFSMTGSTIQTATLFSYYIGSRGVNLSRVVATISLNWTDETTFNSLKNTYITSWLSTIGSPYGTGPSKAKFWVSTTATGTVAAV